METSLSCDCAACLGTWAEVGNTFTRWRAASDSVQFEHEDYWTDRVGDLKEVTR